jgi:hypothetical protein
LSISDGRGYLPRVRYPNAEDRLNPLTPEGADDTTLGGYPAVHGRAPAFEGKDGEPYTAAIEMERPEGEGGRWSAYLVFLRWAQTGSTIMGHLETQDLAEGETEEEARGALEALPLNSVREILDQEIARRAAEAER